MPTSASRPGELLEPPADDHVEPLPREVEERLGRARRRAAGRADERDLARGVEPLDARDRERSRGEVGLDRGARDEGDAVAGGDGDRADSCSPSSSSGSRSRSRVPARRSSSSITWRTPAPSCITISGSSRSSSRSTVRSGEPVVGRAREHDLVAEERLEDDRRGGGATAPTTPSSSSRSATRSTTVCVSEIESEIATPGFWRWNSQRSTRDDGAARAGGRADLERAAELASVARLRAPRAAAPRARASAGRRGRGRAPPRSARRAGRSGRAACARAASRATATCRLTAGCVTPSRSAACEKLFRSTTAQKQRADACP